MTQERSRAVRMIEMVIIGSVTITLGAVARDAWPQLQHLLLLDQHASVIKIMGPAQVEELQP